MPKRPGIHTARLGPDHSIPVPGMKLVYRFGGVIVREWDGDRARLDEFFALHREFKVFIRGTLPGPWEELGFARCGRIFARPPKDHG